MPRGVVRFCCSMCTLTAMFTKRETRNNRPMPISRPMITFAAGELSNPFMTFVLFRGWLVLATNSCPIAPALLAEVS